jgi:hypothetical protein
VLLFWVTVGRRAFRLVELFGEADGESAGHAASRDHHVLVVHAHEELSDWFLEFFFEGLEGHADVVVAEELLDLHFQLLSLLALVQRLQQRLLRR